MLRLIEWAMAEPLSAVLGAVALVLSAVSSMAIFKKRKEPPPIGTADALTLAIKENTDTHLQVLEQFEDNNKLFQYNLEVVRDIRSILMNSQKDTNQQISLLSQILAETIRNSRNR